MQFSPDIEQAGQLLAASGLGHPLSKAWSAIDWRELPHRIGQDAVVNETNLGSINLFPTLAELKPEARSAALIREFGVSLFRRYGSPEIKQRWELKLVLPLARQIDAVQERLRDPQYPTYEAIKDSFSTLLDRYVSLNLTNALLANNISRTGALNLDLRQWGSTLAYANLRKAHSLKPFVTAYGPVSTAECPGRGLAEKLVYGLRHISEASLAEAYGRLITDLFLACQP